MKIALRKSKDRIGDINAQVEDTLSGIRVVKSFTNEEIEKRSSLMKIIALSAAETTDIKVKHTLLEG